METEKMKAILRSFIKKDVRDNLIARLAYHRAEQRRFQNGDATGDWLAAEKEVDEKIMGALRPNGQSTSILTEYAAVVAAVTT